VRGENFLGTTRIRTDERSRPEALWSGEKYKKTGKTIRKEVAGKLAGVRKKRDHNKICRGKGEEWRKELGKQEFAGLGVRKEREDARGEATKKKAAERACQREGGGKNF